VARQNNSALVAGRKNEIVFSTGDRRGRRPAASVIRQSHQHARMRQSVLLPQRGVYFHPRFTPARAMRGQFDAQRPHEFRLPKYPLHRATILVAHPRVTSEFGFESEFTGGPSFAHGISQGSRTPLTF
jgi:hypothetical protein